MKPTVKKQIKKITLTLAAAMIGMSASAYIIHDVKRGDTLYGLSNKYKVSADDIIRHNPSVKNGLKAGTKIRIPESGDVADTPTPKAQESSPQPIEEYMEVETSNISHEPIDIDEHSNAAEKPRHDDSNIIVISPDSEASAMPEEDAIQKPYRLDVGSDRYVARFGDTMQSISHKTGVEEAILIRLNPLVDPLHVPEGEIIRLSDDAPFGTLRTDLTLADSVVYRINTSASSDGGYYGQDREVGIAVMLPFDLKHDVIGKQALLATEFYKGFMLATREHAPEIDYSLRIFAIDTSDPSELAGQLRSLKDKGVNVIIPPDDESQLRLIEDFANKSGDDITVFNVLNVRDDGYLNNPNVVQCNISQKLMYAKAIKALNTYYPDYIPVVLTLAGGKDEKSGFVEMLREDYESKNKKVIDISFNENLKESDLSALKPDYKYIFIPKSGSQDVFDKFSETIIKQIENDTYPERLKVFGYPDWVVFRGSSKEALHRLGAVIYSRFSYDSSDASVREMSSQFKNWYGHSLTDVFPSQGTLGYDAANLLYKMIDKGWLGNDATSYFVGNHSGLQSTFRLVRPAEGGGLINDTLYIIEFLPGEGSYIRTL